MEREKEKVEREEENMQVVLCLLVDRITKRGSY